MKGKWRRAWRLDVRLMTLICLSVIPLNLLAIIGSHAALMESRERIAITCRNGFESLADDLNHRASWVGIEHGGAQGIPRFIHHHEGLPETGHADARNKRSFTIIDVYQLYSFLRAEVAAILLLRGVVPVLVHADEAVILDMVNDGVASLGGKDDAQSGWDALFSAHNGGEGYAAEQKIAIKANINGSAVYDDDTSGETRMSYTNPVLLKALLTSLVTEAGVAPSDVTVYDVSRLFPDYMVAMCNEGILSGVRFVGRNNGVADETAPIEWSHAFSGKVNYLPTCVTEATYVINLANLKGHSYGVTLCAKNHFGSFINGNLMRPPEGANLHQWLTRGEMGIYSPLVDLMANAHLGGKTVLYMLDALICAVSEGSSMTGDNTRWRQAPFDGDYAQSIFLSQDPVAIDSVGADFLMNEPTVTDANGALRGNASVENYLHEAGFAANAPSGVRYAAGARSPRSRPSAWRFHVK